MKVTTVIQYYIKEFSTQIDMENMNKILQPHL